MPLVLSLLLLLLTSAAIAEPADDSELIRSTDANQLKVYFVSPFRLYSSKEEIEPQKFEADFEAFKQKFLIKDDYKVFQKTIKKIIKETGLCSSGGDIESALKDCFNHRPDEAAALSSIIHYYLAWKSQRVKLILQEYSEKMKSTRLSDRIEAKLFFDCIKEREEDTYEVLEECRDPENWSFSSLWPQLKDCSSGEVFGIESELTGEEKAEFDFRNFVVKCIGKKFLEEFDDNPGAQAAVNLLLNLRMKVDSDGLEIEFYPFETSTKVIFESIRARTLEILNSEWYNRLATEGCIPSVFVPVGSSVSDDDIKKRFFYSVCIPPKVVQKISALPKADAEYFRAVLSIKIAALQTLELLYGSQMIAQEAERFLSAVDQDLARFAQYNNRFVKTLAEQYKSAVDLAYATKIEDVLEAIDELYALYVQEKESLKAAAEDLAAEMKRQKLLFESGRDEPDATSVQ